MPAPHGLHLNNDQTRAGPYRCYLQVGAVTFSDQEVSEFREVFELVDVDKGGTIEADEVTQVFANKSCPLAQAILHFCSRGANT